MQQTTIIEQGQPMSEAKSQYGHSGVTFIDVLIFFAKYKKVLIGLPILMAILAATYALLAAPTYQATTKLLPPQQSQSASAALLSQLGGVASMAAGISGGLKNPNDMYIGMLRSRTVADKLISRFKLEQVFGRQSMEKTRRQLAEITTLTSGKDGMITIDVEGEDPELASKLANAYGEELLNLTRNLAITDASQRRVFFEKQLQQSKDNLAQAEIALKAALESRGVISVDSESKAILETAARLRAQVSAKEVQLNSMKAFVTSSNPEYRRSSEELASLKVELSRLENGRGNPGGLASGQGGLENIKLLRDVKYHQMLHELLAKQYEIARLDEAKEPTIVQVLDAAIVPEIPVKPRRLMLVLLGAAIGLVLAAFAALIAEAKAQALSSPEEATKWAKFKSHLA